MVGLGSWLFFVVFVVGCFGLGFLGFFCCLVLGFVIVVVLVF